MKVDEIMALNVATVGQDASLKQVAELMVARGISGIPVVNAEHRVLGVVSEADIILKAASRPESAGVLGRLLAPRAVDERHLAATTAGEAMSAPAVTIDAGQSVAEAARLMVEHRVNRLPVLTEGRLVGIVTRADVVRAFTRSDGEIWEELRNDVIPSRLWISPDELDVQVTSGRVRIAGRVKTRTEAELVEAFAWRVPGVVSVDCSGVTWEADDRALRSPGEPVVRVSRSR
jgi:CBS domain-containing protein